MVKRLFWKQMVVGEEELADRLTNLNLQPNKFKILHLGEREVLVVYIEREIKNVD